MNLGEITMGSSTREVLNAAAEKDPAILTAKEDIEKSLGQDPRYLKTLGLEKNHLIRLERLGLAVKARYSTANKTGRRVFGSEEAVTGPHRTRWIIFSEAVT